MTVAQPGSFTPLEVEKASRRDGKHYELIDGELREKIVGTRSLFIASRLCEKLNAAFYPKVGFSAVEAMVYCFAQSGRGRKPDVSYVRFDRLGTMEIPEGDLHIAPELVVEVLSPSNSGIEMEAKLDEYLEAGIAMVWIVNPEPRTIRVYRNDGTTRLFRATDVIENELLLPGFRLVTGEIFPTP